MENKTEENDFGQNLSKVREKKGKGYFLKVKSIGYFIGAIFLLIMAIYFLVIGIMNFFIVLLIISIILLVLGIIYWKMTPKPFIYSPY